MFQLWNDLECPTLALAHGAARRRRHRAPRRDRRRDRGGRLQDRVHRGAPRADPGRHLEGRRARDRGPPGAPLVPDRRALRRPARRGDRSRLRGRSRRRGPGAPRGPPAAGRVGRSARGARGQGARSGATAARPSRGRRWRTSRGRSRACALRPKRARDSAAFLEKRDPSWKAAAAVTFKRVLVANRGEIASRDHPDAARHGDRARRGLLGRRPRRPVRARGGPRGRDRAGAGRGSPTWTSRRSSPPRRRRRPRRSIPGYGFLSENAAFAAACEKAGIRFIGPPASAIEKLGNKTCRARARGEGRSSRPCRAPSSARTTGRPASRRREGRVPGAREGRGRRRREGDAPRRPRRGPRPALAAARRESRAAFGSDALILERCVERRAARRGPGASGTPRATILPILERDCSLQRRHQKIVEECPSPAVDARAAREAARAAPRSSPRPAGYESAGTLEFLLTPQGEVFFLEMNTRLQVEHPVTELVCGARPRRLAGRDRGGPRSPSAPPIEPRGHAIEARVYAEDPATGFLPQTGTLARVRWPSGPGIRVDAGVETGSVDHAALRPDARQGDRVGSRAARRRAARLLDAPPRDAARRRDDERPVPDRDARVRPLREERLPHDVRRRRRVRPRPRARPGAGGGPRTSHAAAVTAKTAAQPGRTGRPGSDAVGRARRVPDRGRTARWLIAAYRRSRRCSHWDGVELTLLVGDRIVRGAVERAGEPAARAPPRARLGVRRGGSRAAPRRTRSAAPSELFAPMTGTVVQVLADGRAGRRVRHRRS